MKYFPVNFNIAGKKVLVVGGGRVAYRKVKNLLTCGSKITVVSPVFYKPLLKMACIRLIKRCYRKSDICGMCLVISATDSYSVNRRVYEHATNACVPVNVVDQPDLCTFTVPSVIRKGGLLITVSTGGGSPALARVVRKKVEKEIGNIFTRHLLLLKEIREKVKESDLNEKQRADLFKKMAGKKIYETIEKKGVKSARVLMHSMLKKYIKGSS